MHLHASYCSFLHLLVNVSSTQFLQRTLVNTCQIRHEVKIHFPVCSQQNSSSIHDIIAKNSVLQLISKPASVVLSVASQYTLPGYSDWRVWVIAAYALRLNSQAGTEGSTVSFLICDRWLILGLETLSISRCLNH